MAAILDKNRATYSGAPIQVGQWENKLPPSKIVWENGARFRHEERTVDMAQKHRLFWFRHTPEHLAKDIIEVLHFLRSKGVAHRDLKPENVLITNNHVTTTDAGYWWPEKPIVAILSHFGEARSSLIQTKIPAETRTHQLFRSSPAYMAPEALLCDSSRGTIQDLLKMDIWSLGMTKWKRSRNTESLPELKQNCKPRAESVNVKSLRPVMGPDNILNKPTIAELADENTCSTTKVQKSPTIFLKIKDFIDNNAYHQQLNSWCKWWLQRKSHVLRAFKAEDTPASKLAEIGHAKIASVGRQFMSLLETAREDTAFSIRQDAEMRLFDSGLSRGGKGPTSNQRKAKEYNAGIKRATSYAAELDREGEPPCKNTPCFVPSKGKHRPPEGPPSKKKKQNEKQMPGLSQPERPLPFHVILCGTIFNLRKCYGCGKDFKNKHKVEPNDLILKHYCYRRYKDKNGNNTVSRVLQAAYFHLKLDCTRKEVPTMEIDDVIIHEEVANSLSDRHKNTLRKFEITM
ncbi:unnamed protein product [Mytilus coruscus]|uniref:Protein kinase domain-containing protein n=1 Tax=Mytilus coruscus TaxID=42192 RepID=A0A6J8CI74_MYTCO|nr:unnamed protein product [Mytilus coruscus]